MPTEGQGWRDVTALDVITSMVQEGWIDGPLADNPVLGAGAAEMAASARQVLLHVQRPEDGEINDTVLKDVAAETARVDKLDPVPDAPTMQDLTSSMTQFPLEDLDEAHSRLSALVRRDAYWLESAGTVIAVLPSDDDGAKLRKERQPSLQTLTTGLVLDIHEVAAVWYGTEGQSPRPMHPVAPLVRAWWKTRPRPIQRSTRTKRRIIPAKLAQHNPQDHRTRKGLFLPDAHIDATGQRALPGLQVERLRPAPPLELYEMGYRTGDVEHKGGRVVPLSQRIFIEALLAVPMAHRVDGTPLTFPVALNEFLSWFWPNRTPKPNEYMPALYRAAQELANLRIPIINPATGRGQARNVVTLVGVPRHQHREAADEEIEIQVYLPTGSQIGPQVSDNLRYWATRSAAAWRVLLNSAFLWFDPGQTHAPVGSRGHRYWKRVHQPDRYPVLTNQDLIDLCHPTTTNTTNNRVYLQRAVRALKKLEAAGELRFSGEPGTWHVLPPLPKKKTSPQ